MRAMVLTYIPELKHSMWCDFQSRHRSRDSLEKRLRKGVRDGEWFGWRIMDIQKQVIGFDSANAG